MQCALVSLSLVALGTLIPGRPMAPAAQQFTLRPPGSAFSWTSTTSQGAISGSTQIVEFVGTVDLDLIGEPGGLSSGRIVRADVALRNDLLGKFPGQLGNGFQLLGARLDLTSPSFSISSDGTFTTTLTPVFRDGELQVAAPLGPAGVLFLDGRPLSPVVVTGRLRPSGGVLRLAMPADLGYDFGVGAVTGSLEMSGKFAAGLRIRHRRAAR